MTKGYIFWVFHVVFEGPFDLLLSAASSPHHRGSCGGVGELLVLFLLMLWLETGFILVH